jgi:hypothetical protein
MLLVTKLLRLGFLTHPTKKNINPEDDKCNIYRNVRKPSTSYVEYSRKPKLYIKLQLPKPDDLCSFDLLRVAVFASHPALVLFASSWVVAALVYGAFDLQVTSDPVEMWASPQSRSRLEKEYFDSRFEPFYRMEQVFVKAVGIQKVSMRVVQMKPVQGLFWAKE